METGFHLNGKTNKMRYLQEIISPGKRELLNSFLDAQLNFIHLWFHEVFKTFFRSSGCLSLDDDMDRYKGK